MIKSKDQFNKLRERLMIDERESNNYPPFDHDKNFQRKVKENWLTTEEFRELKNASLFELTQALIDKKMSVDYFEEVMKLIDKKEPFHIGRHHADYFFKFVLFGPLDNLERIYKKYTESLQRTIKYDYRIILETEILKRKNNG